MCDFKPGDEVVCVDDVPSPKRAEIIRRRGWSIPWDLCAGKIYRVSSVMCAEDALRAFQNRYPGFPVRLNGCEVVYVSLEANKSVAFSARRFRKVQRRKTDLSIEAFSVIKDGGFEEPRKVPEKHKEKAQ